MPCVTAYFMDSLLKQQRVFNNESTKYEDDMPNVYSSIAM